MTYCNNVRSTYVLKSHRKGKRVMHISSCCHDNLKKSHLESDVVEMCNQHENDLFYCWYKLVINVSIQSVTKITIK